PPSDGGTGEPGSACGEPWRTLLVESADSLRPVSRVGNSSVDFVLDDQTGAEVAIQPGIDRQLGLADGQWSVGADGVRQGTGERDQLAARRERVDWTDPLGLVALDVTASEDQLLGSGRANQPRQHLSAAPAGQDPHP